MLSSYKDFLSQINPLIKNVKVFLTGRFIFAAITLLVGILTARLLSPENRGLYTLFFTLSGLLTTIGHVGISPANIFFFNKKKIPINVLFGNSLIYTLLVFIIFSTFLFLIYLLLGISFGFEENNLYLIYVLLGCSFFFQLLDTCFQGLLLANRQYTFLSKALVIHSAVLLFATLVLLMTDKIILIALELRVIFVSIFILGFIVILFKKFEIQKVAFSRSIMIDQLRFGSKNWMQNLIGFLNIRSYILFLAVLSSPDHVGFFSIAYIFVELIRFLPDTLGTMILPELTKVKSQDMQNITALNALKITFLLVVLIVLIIFFLSDSIVPLIFGSSYAPSIISTKVIIFGGLLGVIYQVLTRYFTSQDKQQYSVISSLFGLATGLISCAFFIPLYDSLGASISFTISAFSTGVLQIYFFMKMTKFSLLDIIRTKII